VGCSRDVRTYDRRYRLRGVVGNDTYEGGYGTMDGGAEGIFASHLCILSSSGSGKDPEICLFIALQFCMFFKDQDDIHEKKVSGIKR